MNSQKKLSVIGFGVVVLLGAILAGYLGGRLAPGSTDKGLDAMADIVSSRRLRAGYIVFPPAISKEPGADDPTGHMIDAIRYIGSELDADVELQETTWATFAAGLQARHYDIVVAPLFATPSRATAVAFTTPLYYLGMSIIVQRDDNRFRSLDDLNKAAMRIAVNQGGANQKFAKRYFPNAQLTELATANISQVLSEVVAGRADAAVADTWSVSRFVQEQAESVRSRFEELDVTAISWAVRSEDTRLLGFLNTTIDYLHTTGKMREFEERYDAHWLHLKREWDSR